MLGDRRPGFVPYVQRSTATGPSRREWWLLVGWVAVVASLVFVAAFDFAGLL